MSEKLLTKTVPMQVTLIALFILIISKDLPHVEARHITKKPPFNGSMFGKRSVLPPVTPPTYDLADINGALITGSKIGNENAYNAWTKLLYKQIQEQQDLSLLSGAISRCLEQLRDGLIVRADIIDACDELYALASARDRSQ